MTPEDFEGYALNQARWELSEAAEAADLQPLDEFVSMSPEESEILAADLNFDTDVDALTPAGWFDSRIGLRLVQTLLGTVTEDPEAFSRRAHVDRGTHRTGDGPFGRRPRRSAFPAVGGLLTARGEGKPLPTPHPARAARREWMPSGFHHRLLTACGKTQAAQLL